jgi:Transposase IS4
LIYQGSATEINQEIMQKFGLRKVVVFHMAKRLANPGHKLYVDNYFSTYQVFEVLKELKINAAGTLWIDLHIHHFSLIRKWKWKVADFSTRLKGVMESRDGSSGSRDGKVILIKWQDNKPVFVGSNFMGKSVGKSVNRSTNWSVFIAFLWNLKKNTIRVISHFSDFAVCASLINYKTKLKPSKANRKDAMDLLEFRQALAKELTAVKGASRKRARISLESTIESPKSAKNGWQTSSSGNPIWCIWSFSGTFNLI